jgi:hypothetical protein
MMSLPQFSADEAAILRMIEDRPPERAAQMLGKLAETFLGNRTQARQLRADAGLRLS